MVGPAVSVRCPACGTPLRALLAPAPSTQWLSCPSCHRSVPALVPRDPPPLYTWEVYPGLYPALPPPRHSRWSGRRLAAGALLGVAVMAVVLAALFAYYATAAPAGGSFDTNGTVLLQTSGGTLLPATGATVTVTPESGPARSTVVGGNGAFTLSGLPTGGLSIHFQEPGYSPVIVLAFVSPLFSAGAAGLLVQLAPGSAANATTVSLTPFPTLEQFVAAIAAGALVLALVAAVAVLAGFRTLRDDRPALGIVGGGAGLFAPIALLDLSLGGPFPLLLLASGIGAALGAFVLVLRAAHLLRTGPAAG